MSWSSIRSEMYELSSIYKTFYSDQWYKMASSELILWLIKRSVLHMFSTSDAIEFERSKWSTLHITWITPTAATSKINSTSKELLYEKTQEKGSVYCMALECISTLLHLYKGQIRSKMECCCANLTIYPRQNLKLFTQPCEELTYFPPSTPTDATSEACR